MQVQWMEKPKPPISHTSGPAAASGQPERAVPQLWTCAGYELTDLHAYTCPFPFVEHIHLRGLFTYVLTLYALDLSFVFDAADHVSHLENVSEDEINRLLGMVVDVENLFMSVHKEEDTDTKQVYFYLFKVSTVYLAK